MGFVFGEVDTELPAAAAPGDADGNAPVPAVTGRGQLWNGTTWEREPANQEGVLLAYATRTGYVASPDQVNRGHRGVFLGINVSAASGTGGLRVGISTRSNGQSILLAQTGAITTASRWGCMLYPGSSGTESAAGAALIVIKSLVLPRSWFAYVAPDDASSYTYSLTYSLIL